MAIYKAKDKTKDGKQWFFRVSYIDLYGNRKLFKSKKFLNKKEAQDAEVKYLFNQSQRSNEVQSDITFEELISLFIDYKKDKVRITTMKGYLNNNRYLESFYKVKLKDFTIQQFEAWKKDLNLKNMSTIYKNDIYKYLKQLLNYASKWYDFNFKNIYEKMTNFTNPNERKKEMLFFTYEEFQRFIAVEDDIRFKCLFETLYYCGLRRGEARGLTWADIDFSKKTLSVNKQICSLYSGTHFQFTDPKTKSSIRTIPLPKVLCDDLILLKEQAKKVYGFTDKYFIFGDAFPVGNNTMMDHKNMNCLKAGLHQIRLHDFRHSCASLLINNGANITIVARYLGHTKIDETLNTYSHLFVNAMDDVINVIDNL